ncbi:MAG: hypothetical protein AAGO57_07470 [Pseudomonadota bacterium]
MAKKIEATIARDAKTGRFTLRKDGTERVIKNPGKATATAVNRSITKNRDALQRLANR